MTTIKIILEAIIFITIAFCFFSFGKFLGYKKGYEEGDKEGFESGVQFGKLDINKDESTIIFRVKKEQKDHE